MSSIKRSNTIYLYIYQWVTIYVYNTTKFYNTLSISLSALTHRWMNECMNSFSWPLSWFCIFNCCEQSFTLAILLMIRFVLLFVFPPPRSASVDEQHLGYKYSILPLFPHLSSWYSTDVNELLLLLRCRHVAAVVWAPRGASTHWAICVERIRPRVPHGTCRWCVARCPPSACGMRVVHWFSA